MPPPLRLAAAAAFCLAAFPTFAAVNGVVMSADGQPVAGARVSIYGYETQDARRARLLSPSPEAVPLASAQTDGRGTFSLASPKDAVVTLTVAARGYMPVLRRVEKDEETGAIALTKAETQSGTISAGGKPLAGATVVVMYAGGYEHVVTTGENGKIEAPDLKRARSIAAIHPSYAIDEETFMMTRGSASKLTRTLVAGTEMKGNVVAADGRSPVSGAAVTLDGWPVATSGDDGAFTIAHVAAKWTTLGARKDALRGFRAFAKEGSLSIRLARSATLTGRVLDRKTKMPVAGAIVTAAVPGLGFTGEGTAATTDAKGAYSIASLPGSFMIGATHPAYDMTQVDAAVTAGGTVSKDLSLTPLARVTGVVVDERSKPVAAARVTTENAGDPLMTMVRMVRMDGGGDVASGPDGRFAIRVQADTDLRVKASKKGLPLVKSETLKLAPGERKTGVVLTMPSGVIVTGKVTDGDGKPLSGVSVTPAENESGRGGMQRMIVSRFLPPDEDAVQTASDGTFSLRLKEGSYDFTFKREGFATRSVRAQTINATGENVVDAKLDAAVDIRGRVVRNGTGVADVAVFAMIADNDGRATTGPDGTFTLSGINPGQVRISFRKDEEFVQETRTINAPAHDVVVELPAGMRVSGRVVEKGTAKPVTQFQVGLSRSRSGGGMVMVGPPQLRSFTSDDGAFTLEGVPAGGQDLVATAPGYAGGRLNINVEEGKALSGLEIELDTGTRVVGKVTGPNGAPLSDATVSLAFAPGSSTMRMGNLNRAVTDANGEYALEALASGEETLEFSHPKYVGTRKDVSIKGRELRVDAQLGGGVRVSGVVVTEAGAPVAEADVTAMASGGSRRQARTNASGAFEFESLAPARYRFTADKAGLATARIEDVDVSSGAPVRITMKTGGTIYGRVTGLSAEEFSLVSVDVTGGGAFLSASVDASGNYKIEGVPAGTLQVIATVTPRSLTGRRTTPSQAVQVEAGSARQVDLEFSNATVIRGRVTRNGVPLKGANIGFAPKMRGMQSMNGGSTDEDGRYSVTGLEDGEYNVTVVDMQRFSPYTTTYSVRGSATFDIDYKAGTLRGRILDATTNAPVADASVQLRSTDGAPDPFRGLRAATTDPSGAFVLDGVAPGAYVLNATKEGYGNEARDLVVTERMPDDVELKLMRNDGVLLKVVDARDGHALDASVAAYDMQNRLVHENRMFFGGAEGAAEVKLPVAPGRYTVWVASLGYAPRSVSVTSPSTQTVALTPGGSVVIRSKQSFHARVRLVDASGSPYPRLTNRPAWTELAPSPATAQIEHVAPGTYTLQLLGDNDTVLDSTRVTVAEGQVSTTEI